MVVTELIDGLYIIPGLVNVYLLNSPGGLTLIDAGFPRDTSKILKGITSIGRNPDDVRHILLTHAHPDHIGGAAALRKRTGAQVYAIAPMHRSSKRADRSDPLGPLRDFGTKSSTLC